MQNKTGWIPLALALMAASAAQAQTSPYYLRLQQNIDYDSNLFRQATNEQSDVISTTSVGVGLDQPIGRQRLFANANVGRVIYKNNDELNHTRYDLAAGLNWEAASRLSGLLQFNLARAQARFDDYGSTAGPIATLNEEKSSSADARVQYGGASLLSVEALANYTRVRYGQSNFAARDRNSHMFGGGVRYHPSSLLTLGLLLRRTEGEYPAAGGLAVADEYTRNDIDLTAQWQPSALTSLRARLTHTKEEHDLDATRDFSGLTGEMGWDYQVTGKVSLGLTLARETGSGTQVTALLLPTAPGSTPPPSATPATTPSYLNDSRLTSRLGLRVTWDATAKIRVAGGYDYSRDRYDSSFVSSGGGGATGTEGNTRRYSLTAGWNATRNLSFGCGAAHEERNSDLTVSGGGSYGYTVTTGYCNAALILQ